VLAGAAVPLYALATALLWLVARPYGNTRWKQACVAALGSAVVAMLVNQAISHTWARPRPFAAHLDGTHLLAPASADPSFPSDHAAAAFAIAFAVLAFSWRAGAGFLAAATLIGLSRIALGLHYPTDVLAGAAVGWASALLVTTVGKPWVSRIVSLLSRVSDPLLAPVWRRLPRRLLAR
jgi:undecaprenyl-diphosphatase